MQVKAINSVLKEWSVACRALEEGRQIILLRKGGLLDAEGAFELEAARFWLCPTKWHQDANLLKPAHRDLLENDVPPAREVLQLSAWAEVAQVWALDVRESATENKLAQLEHIWSTRYLDVRLGYQPDKPLLIVALRVQVTSAAHVVAARPEYFGCKSWIELEKPLSTGPSRPALCDEAFAERLETARRVLDAC
jgi:hypothetical protein